jgi:peptidoglycan hydrolase-like protein with peptidoglycan-binding domain
MSTESFDEEIMDLDDAQDAVDSAADPEPDLQLTVVEDEPEPEPEPKAKSQKGKKVVTDRKPSPAGAAVSGGETDNVSLAACVFKNKMQKKSLSVHHVQRRLAELGYPDAYTDKDGWYGDLTRAAVSQYQDAVGISNDGIIDMMTLESLFSDDRNVNVTA